MDSGFLSKTFFYFSLIFLFLVLANWGFDSLKLFVQFPAWNYSGKQLAAIDLSLFSEEIKNGYISQGYGSVNFRYLSGRHNGIDIVAKQGAPISSLLDGRVLYSGDQDNFCLRRNYGKFLAIRNNDNKVLLYAHLSKINVKKGDAVKVGQKIAEVGATGLATSPHLHLTVFSGETFKIGERKDCGPNPEGNHMNPAKYLESLE